MTTEDRNAGDDAGPDLQQSAFGVADSAPSAVLLVSFGGPESPDEVMPFLENVVRGKNVPPQRLLEVAGHYESLGGVSPTNGQNRALLAALVHELNTHGPRLPVYWGNRNWHPLLADAVRSMAEDGVRHAFALVTSAFGSHPTCREYLEDIERARREVGPEAPQIDKLRLFYNHPGFIASVADRAAAALALAPVERRRTARLVFTAHSIPAAMAERCPYQRQLQEACRLTVESLTASRDWNGAAWALVFQSRSGPPAQPWLGPDIRDHIERLGRAGGTTDVVIVPIGFLVESMEVVYDLDVEVRALCDRLGIHFVRAAVAGAHPKLVRMVRELIEERLRPAVERLALGADGPWPDSCSNDCCG
jgi:protoporphyrin/coproporphyrin ferrochelatase